MFLFSPLPPKTLGLRWCFVFFIATSYQCLNVSLRTMQSLQISLSSVGSGFMSQNFRNSHLLQYDISIFVLHPTIRLQTGQLIGVMVISSSSFCVPSVSTSGQAVYPLKDNTNLSTACSVETPVFWLSSYVPTVLRFARILFSRQSSQ